MEQMDDLGVLPSLGNPQFVCCFSCFKPYSIYFGMIWRDFSNVRLVEYTRMVDEYGEVGHKNGMITTCWDIDILTISIRIMI